MKANKFFLGLALIGAILTGCENKEPETNGDEAKAYMSVRISMASTAGTRATDGGFNVGNATEQVINVNNSIFLFYDVHGNWVTSGQLQSTAVNENGDCDLSAIGDNAYIVLSGPDSELDKSTQVLTVVNYSGCNSLKNLNLNEALAKITDTSTDAATKFLMSTSVYVKDGAIVNTTAITSANIAESQALAKENPVVIHIERASAKAELGVKTNPTVLESEDKKIVVDGVLSKVRVTVTGWTLNNVNEGTYLVKQLHGGSDPYDFSKDANKPFDGWNWADGHRSYWAVGTKWTATDNAGNTVYALNSAIKKADNTEYMYCYENTVAVPACAKGEDEPNVNTVLIAANIEVPKADDATVWEEDKNLYEYGGVFYREDTYKDLILKQLNDMEIKYDGASLTRDDISFVQTTPKSLAGIAFRLVPDEDKYSEGTGYISKATIETTINALPYIDEALGYLGGRCYYQIPVEHLGAASSLAQYGMVRNHWYKITINSINHVGEPVFDPEVIIPEIPAETQEYYLAAEIHILSWHLVNQTVDL